MKKIITTLFISVTLIVSGQITKIVGDSLTREFMPNNFPFFSYNNVEGQDTIGVVMIVSDSIGRVLQVTGYDVRKKLCCTNGYIGEYAIYQPVPYYEHLFYLNDKKKLFSKGITVWISKGK